MDAVILPFKRPGRALTCSPLPTLHARLIDTIAQTVMQDYAACPWPVIQDAIARADEALNNGESFFEAVEAAENVVLAHHQRGGNPLLADALAKQRRRRQDAFFHQAARVIRDRLKNRHVDVHYALARARRVIEGGGTINAALHHALGDDFESGGV